MKLIAILGAAALAAAPATADDGARVDITGQWSFETEMFDIVCKMTGELSLQATDDPNVYEGRLIAYEACNGEQLYQAEQDVVANRKSDQLQIVATLTRVLPSPENYAPDNFQLTIVNGALMTGELRSADIAPATFRRREDLIS